MPNWITNNVTVTADNPHKLEELADIFRNEAPFNHLVPEPDWPNIPASKDLTDRFDRKRSSTAKLIAKKGELPEKEIMKLAGGEEYITWRWPSSGRQDDRWYGWRTDSANWGCKWDIHDVEVDYQKAGNLVHLTFLTPWCPPDGIYNKLCDMGYEFLMWEWQDECEDAVHDLIPLEVVA